MVKKIKNLNIELELENYPKLSGKEADILKFKNKIKTVIFSEELVIEKIESNNIFFKGKELVLDSAYLSKAFESCRAVSIVCVSLGQEFSDYIQDSMGNNRLYLGALADAYGSEYVEALAQKWLDSEKRSKLIKGLYPTLRFSPGYGDFKLKYQKDLIALLGMEDQVNVTENFLLEPAKTITFVCGWSNTPQIQEYPTGMRANSCPGGGVCALCQTWACMKK